MAEIRGERWDGLGWRLPLSLFFAALALFLANLALHASSMLLCLALLVFAAASLLMAVIVMGTILAGVASHFFVGAFLVDLIYPDRRARRPPPVYGPAEARRMEGRYEEAIQAYEAILAEYPADGHCYLALMDIAWRELHDARRAMGFYQRASAAVKDKAYRQEMRQAYEDFAPGLIEQYQFSMPRPSKPSTPTRHYLDE